MLRLKKITSKYHIMIVLFFPIIVTLIFWQLLNGPYKENESIDYIGFYLPVAKNILANKGITINGHIALDYPPGYPVIIAFISGVAETLQIQQDIMVKYSTLIFIMLCSFFIYKIARTIWTPFNSIIASSLWTCYPLILWLTKQPNSEIPYMLIFYSAFYCYITGLRLKKYSALLFLTVGLLCGFGMLIRPIGIGCGVIFAFLLMINRAFALKKRILMAFLILLANIIAVFPWELYVYQNTKQIVVLCKGHDSYSIFDGLTFAEFNPDGNRSGISVPDDVRKFMREIVTNCGPSAKTTELIDAVITKASIQPVTVAKLLSIKALRSWYGTDSNRLENYIIILQIIYLIMLFTAIYHFFIKRKEHHYLLLVCGIFLFYFWGMTIMVLSIVRYMTPILGLLFIFFPVLFQIIPYVAGCKFILKK